MDLASIYWKLGQRDNAIRYDRLYVERGSHAHLKELSRKRLREDLP